MNPARAPFPPAARRACARHGIAPTRYFLTVNIARQTTALFERRRGGYELRKTFRCSTSKFGIGERAGSNMTPRGLHCVGEKVGGGWPVGRPSRAGGWWDSPGKGGRWLPLPTAFSGWKVWKRASTAAATAIRAGAAFTFTAPATKRPSAGPIPTGAFICRPTTWCLSTTNCRKARWSGSPKGQASAASDFQP